MTRRRSGRTLRWLGLTSVALIALTLALWQAGLDPRAPGEGVAQIHAALEPWRAPLQLARLGAWALAWWAWNGALARVLGITAQQRAQWALLRPRVIGGLLALEALIVLSRVAG